MIIFRLAILLAALLVSSPLIAQDEQADAQPEQAQPAQEEETPSTDAQPAQEQDEDAPENKPDAPATAETKQDEEPEEKDEGQASEGEMEAQVVLEDLNNPCGLAFQPETGTLFVADSGNHQVIKVVDGKAEPMITDFPHDVYGKGPIVNIGPLGLLFLNKNTLVVGGGGLPDGEELLRVYELPENDEPIKADGMKSSFRLEETDDIKGEGNFYALAATPEAIYVTCNGDDTKGWVARAVLEGQQIESYERYLATKEATQVDAPVGVAISPEGYLVIGQMGEINIPSDSLITFYDANSKEMLLNIETDLHDIAAVAYSPRGQMYVLDYSWADPSQGGLFQIIEDLESDTGVRTKKIMSLDKPTAMAFDADGSLFITVLGEADEEGNSKGQLIQVPPGL